MLCMSLVNRTGIFCTEQFICEVLCRLVISVDEAVHSVVSMQKTSINISSLASATGYVSTTHLESVNPYLGLSERGLVRSLATFTPCMRNDHIIFTR